MDIYVYILGYIGCYKDDSNKHLGYKEVYFRNSLTLAKCREHCKGFKYLGLQVTPILQPTFKFICIQLSKIKNKRDIIFSKR